MSLSPPPPPHPPGRSPRPPQFYDHLHHLLRSPSRLPSFFTSRPPSWTHGLRSPLSLHDLAGPQIRSFGRVDFRAKFARSHESVVVGQDLAARAREERRKRARRMEGERTRARESERRIVLRAPSAAMARQIYLCILRALGADRRNATRLKRPRFSRLSVSTRELSAIRQIYLS